MTPERQAAENIERLRGWHRMTQHDLAEPLGLRQSAIAKIEGGRRTLTLNEAHCIAVRFGVTLDQLCSPCLGLATYPSYWMH